MSRTTVPTASLGRLAAAVGAAALAWVGVVAADVPASVVATGRPVHVSATPAVSTAAGTRVTTVVAEAGAASPVHVSGLA